jgi:cell division protein FtsB
VRSVVSLLQPALRRWIARIGLAAALAISLAYVPYRLLDPVGARHVSDLRSQLRDTRARMAELRSENARYAREIQGLRDDPGVIEDIAREDLGMVRPDEIVIRVESPRKGAK